MFFIAHPLRKVLQPFYYVAQIRVVYRTSVGQGIHNPFIHFFTVVFLNVHALRKVSTSNVLFLQSRFFYRTSVAQDKGR